jgi:hypothetical protein
MAVARKLQVDRGEPNKGWEIIGFMHKSECDAALPVTGKCADGVRHSSRDRIQPGQEESADTWPHVQTAIYQYIDRLGTELRTD